jgi:hypothetical protein
MSLRSRFLRRSLFCLLGMLSGVCAAQLAGNQFIYQPKEWLTYGRVTSFVTGTLQYPPQNEPDILFINAPTGSGPNTSILVGELLQNPSLNNLQPNWIPFTDVSNVAAALGKFAGTPYTDYAFVLSPTALGGANTLCVYYGTGATVAQIQSGTGYSSYSGGNVYPPNATKGDSGCMTFAAQGSSLPNFAYIAALPFKTGGRPQLLVEDKANNTLYIFSNNGETGSNGVLYGFTLASTLPLANGAGPIYTGDFDNDGNTDFIINGQASHTATVYLGNGSGGFPTPATYPFTVNSMLLQDMNGATYTNGNPIQDMVVEGANGVIEIFPGKADGTFATASIGGTATGLNGLSGNGGHLAATYNIDGNGLIEILTTTPIGLSVLENNGGYSPNYTLKNIYNIGPGRSSFALADFLSGNLDLAVDSAEGVIFALGDGNGGFQTSSAYSALAPALGATVGQFRTSSNPTGILDVVVATGSAGFPVQAQLLTGNGAGAFTTPTPANPTNTYGSPSNLPAGLWSNILSGDFNGDGKPDLAYSLTGYPLPASGTGLYVQYGNGDGTFQAPVAVSGASSGNTLYGESTVGTFNSGANAGIANIDANFDDTLIGLSNGPSTGVPFSVGLNKPETNTGFNQVAAGTFKTGSSYQDLVFQNGTSLVPYANKQDGSGTFTAGTALTVPSPVGNYAISTVLLTDIDGDGYGDILVLDHNLASDPSNPSTSTPNWLYIWWGEGDGTFSQTPFSLQLSRNYYLAAVADMNAVGLNDIVLSDGYLVSILYNPGSGSPRTFVSDCGPFSATCNEVYEQHFLAGQGINSLTVQNVRGLSSPDVIVANGGATISNPLVLLGSPAKSSISLAANPPDLNTGGITVLENRVNTQATTWTLTSTPPTSNYGAAFTITATLFSASGVAEPTGSVAFSMDGTAVSGCSSVNVTAGTTSSTATCPVPAGNTYPGGTHTLTAAYSGDSNNSPANLSGTHDIQNVTTTTTAFFCIGPPAASCPAPPAVATPTSLPYPVSLSMYYGQYWNGVLQTTASDSSALTGTVDLNDDYNGVTSTLCVLQVTNSACPTSVGTTQGTSVGTNILTGTYLGDSTHAPSTSPAVTITVNPDTTSATGSGSPATSPQGQPVTLTATLTGNYAAPDGPVAFLYGSTALCSPTLVAGASGDSSTATCTTSSLPAGTDQITASYAGDMNFLPATSAPFSETITPLIAPSFAVTATPNPVNVSVGYAAILSVTVTPLNGFAADVNLACGNLPSEATCIFTPATIAGGAGSATLIVVTTAPHSCGTTQPYFVGGNGGGRGLAPLALPALAGLLAIFIPGKRRWLRALLAVLLAAGATQIIGCSTCTDLGTKPASYTFQVTGTAAAGSSEVESQAVTLNVTI